MTNAVDRPVRRSAHGQAVVAAIPEIVGRLRTVLGRDVLAVLVKRTPRAVSLAELLRDDRFREATRSYLHETYAQFPGSEISGPQVQEFIHSAGADLMPKLMAAHQAGFAADDAQVVSLAAQLVEHLAQTFGVAADDDLRDRLAARYRGLDSLTLEALQDAEYNATEGRYLELVSIINDQPHPDATLLSNARRKQSDGDGPSFGDFGRWLSAAILETR